MIEKTRQIICDEILKIMATYHEQDERGHVDTPGGLEHMGDVWRLLGKWERALKSAAEPKGEAGKEQS